MCDSKKFFYLLILLFFTAACSSVPKNTKNSCAIFEDRYLWYKHTKNAEKKWGVPIHIQLAFVKKESAFNWLAKPPRYKLFKIIHKDLNQKYWNANYFEKLYIKKT